MVKETISSNSVAGRLRYYCYCCCYDDGSAVVFTLSSLTLQLLVRKCVYMLGYLAFCSAGHIRIRMAMMLVSL